MHIINNFCCCWDSYKDLVYTVRPLVVYRYNRNLKDIVQIRLPICTTLSPETTKCSHPRCKACRFLIQTPWVSFPRGTFKIRETFICKSINLIHILICKICNRSFIGETSRKLADNFHEHLKDIHRETTKPVFFFPFQQSESPWWRWYFCHYPQILLHWPSHSSNYGKSSHS